MGNAGNSAAHYLCFSMGQKKLQRFQALETFSNVLQYPDNMKGKWADFFRNNNPITLELACGKGEYSIGLGQAHPGRNFIGIDIKGNRLYIGAKKALQDKMQNVGFMRTQIGRITHYFEADEVSEIWIIFPDPFLKKAKNRLTHPRFLHLYQQILKSGGRINLKTDSRELYDFTQETLIEQGCTIHTDIPDIYGKGLATGALAIQTHYEKMHLEDGRTIYFLSFSLPATEIVIPPKKKKETTHDNPIPPPCYPLIP
jgi:tRNA (guanine-N7-)-methyltransferase